MNRDLTGAAFIIRRENECMAFPIWKTWFLSKEACIVLEHNVSETRTTLLLIAHSYGKSSYADIVGIFVVLEGFRSPEYLPFYFQWKFYFDQTKNLPSARVVVLVVLLNPWWKKRHESKTFRVVPALPRKFKSWLRLISNP